METEIRAVCGACGAVAVPPGAVCVTIRSWDDEATCELSCPGCGCRLTKPVPPPMIRRLLDAGVCVSYPAGTPPAAHAALGESDVAQFVHELEEEMGDQPLVAEGRDSDE